MLFLGSPNEAPGTIFQDGARMYNLGSGIFCFGSIVCPEAVQYNSLNRRHLRENRIEKNILNAPFHFAVLMETNSERSVTHD